MRVSAIVRIFVWGLVACILTGILLTGLGGGNILGGGIFSIGNSFSYPDSDLYSIGDVQVPEDSIDSIEVNWTSGDVKLTVYDGSEFRFSETSSHTLSEDEQMRNRVKDKKMTIQYSVPVSWFNFFRNVGGKTLEIMVPRSAALKDVKINCTSAEIKIDKLTAETVTLNTVSGFLRAENIEAEKLALETVSGGILAEEIAVKEARVETVSGGVTVGGKIQEKLNAESISGALTVESGLCPEKVNMSTVSGEIILGLPHNTKGFTARHDSVSGNFVCNFQVETKDNTATFGDGSADIDFNTVSGGIMLRKS